MGAETVEEIVEEIVEEKVSEQGETIDEAVAIADKIVDTAREMARDDNGISGLLNARFDGVERTLAMLDEKINGLFDSLAVIDALISEVREMEVREVEEKVDGEEPEQTVTVEGDVQTLVADAEVIAPDSVEEVGPQKRQEKRQRIWL